MEKKIFVFILTFFLIIIQIWANAFAELKIESSTPDLWSTKHDVDLTINGSGFDENTKFSIYPDTGNSRASLAKVETPGEANDVIIEGDYAYVADGNSGIQVISIKDPLHPEIVTSIDTPGTAEELICLNQHLYIADGEAGLQIIDVTDPTDPNISGSLVTEDYAYGITALKDNVAIADGSAGVTLINIEDPLEPRKRTTVDTNGTSFAVATIDEYRICVADGESGVVIMTFFEYLTYPPYDPSMPPRPPAIFVFEVATQDTPGTAKDVIVEGNTAFVADSESGLQIINIDSLSSPYIVGELGTEGSTKSVCINGVRAFLADTFDGLRIVDISNQSNPIVKSNTKISNNFESLKIINGKAYVTDQSYGLSIIDINAITFRTDISAIEKEEEEERTLEHINLSDDILFAAYDDKSSPYKSFVHYIDISKPGQPIEIATYFAEDRDDINAMHEYQDRLYMSFSGIRILNSPNGFPLIGTIEYFQVIDVENPNASQLIHEINLDPSYEINHIAAKEEIVYVTERTYFRIINLKEPLGLTYNGIEIDGTATDLSVDNDIAFITTNNGQFQIVDVSDINSPILTQTLTTPGSARSIFLSNNIAYIADGAAGLQIIDVSDPYNPSIIGNVGTQNAATDVSVMGNYAYITDGENGIKVVDISNPENPILLGFIDTPGQADKIELSGNIISVANTDNNITLAALPIEMPSIQYNGSETTVSGTLQSPVREGRYTLRAYNGTESDELDYPITISDADLVSKAIIVAGGGPSAEDWQNDLWESTQNCADHAYQSLIFQGYEPEDILYLTAGQTQRDITGDGMNDIDGFASKANLSDAFQSWAKDPENPVEELIVFLVDHGGDGKFILNHVEDPVYVQEIDFLMDNIQESMPGNLIFIYDACMSGTFLPALTPPPGKNRILISSASKEAASYFVEGIISFSYQFWTKIRFGSTLGNAFITSQKVMKEHQTALIDTDGNGNGNEKTDTLSDIIIGDGRMLASDMPFIASISSPITLNGETEVNLVAYDVRDADGIDRIWAVITPPGFISESPETPVLKLPTIELTDENEDGNYEAIYSKFTISGTYSITVYAVDTLGVYSIPKTTTVTQNVGTSTKGDLNGDTLIDLSDAIIALKVLTESSVYMRPDYIDSGIDVHGDDRVGITELVYILRNIVSQ